VSGPHSAPTLSGKFKEDEQQVHVLKQDLEKAQSSIRELATHVKDLSEALKSLQNEKKLVDVANHNLKKNTISLKKLEEMMSRSLKNFVNRLMKGPHLLQSFVGQTRTFSSKTPILLARLVPGTQGSLNLKK
jgi:septal ring factor EnvC (AmiA/AmiB activator)